MLTQCSWVLCSGIPTGCDQGDILDCSHLKEQLGMIHFHAHSHGCCIGLSPQFHWQLPRIHSWVLVMWAFPQGSSQHGSFLLQNKHEDPESECKQMEVSLLQPKLRSHFCHFCFTVFFWKKVTTVASAHTHYREAEIFGVILEDCVIQLITGNSEELDVPFSFPDAEAKDTKRELWGG